MTNQCLIMLGILLQVTGITSGRAAALLPAVLGLISVIFSWVALTRLKERIGYRQLAAVTALVLGLVDITLSGIHLIRTSENSIGTGSGRLGAIVALGFGVIGIILGVCALALSRKSESENEKKKL